MNIAPGKILISSSNMDDPNFDESIVLIAEYNDQGALGFVINKIFDRPLNELVEFSNSPAFPLYDGGPVDKEHLYFIHQRNDLITGGTQIANNIYMGGDFKETIKHINNNTLTSSDIKIFVGYCGWDSGELETEVAEGSWMVRDADEEIIFYSNP